MSTSPAALSPPSALQTLLTANQPTSSTSSRLPLPVHRLLALQIAHNLRQQHDWTDLRLHTHSPQTRRPLPRPILSGLPPRKLYTHPDEQIELLQKQQQQPQSSDVAGVVQPPEREWVLPSHLRERWSLERFDEIFDAVGPVPTPKDGEVVFEERPAVEGTAGHDEQQKTTPDSRQEENGQDSDWRHKLPKRMLLATLDDDSTVVYYIMHHGLVKPRQN